MFEQFDRVSIVHSSSGVHTDGGYVERYHTEYIISDEEEEGSVTAVASPPPIFLLKPPFVGNSAVGYEDQKNRGGRRVTNKP